MPPAPDPSCDAITRDGPAPPKDGQRSWLSWQRCCWSLVIVPAITHAP